MTPEIIMVIAMLCLAIILFIFEWVRVDMVGLIMMVTLPLMGLVTPSQAIGGLSSNAVVSIIAVIIIGAGLDKTGVMNNLASRILRFTGKKEKNIMMLISGTVAFISGFMQNIGAAALFLPAARRIATQTGIPAARILLPMAYCAIIGGCLTLVGSSPLILLNDLMTVGGKSYPAFGLFSVTPLGIMLVISALVYFSLLGTRILPATKAKSVSGPMSKLLDKTYHDVGTLFELRIPMSFAGPVPLNELNLRPSYYSSVVAIKRAKGKVILAPQFKEKIYPGDHIAVVGLKNYVEALACDLCWNLMPKLETFTEELASTNAGIMEGLITPRSELVGKTSQEYGLRYKFKVSPLAIFRKQKLLVKNLSNIPFEPGDAILLYGNWSRFQMLKKQQDMLVFTEPVPGEIIRENKAKLALGWLTLSLILILGFDLQLSIALLSGAVGMILSKVLTIDEAYKAVDWMTVFLLAGLIPLGLAFENTGAAKLVADSIIGSLGMPSPLILNMVIAVLTSFFTLVTSNVGATVLMVPLAMNMALQCGADPRIAALTVAVAASNTFILPTHQVNALVMRPGGFHTIDYVRAGAGMTLLYLVIMIGGMALFYGL